MAQATGVEFPIALEPGRIPDVLGCRCRDVRGGVSVTFGAADPELILPGIAGPSALLLDREPGTVAFKAARHHHVGEVDLAIGIARAVDPRVRRREVGNREFHQDAVAPVAVGLAPPTGTDDQVDRLGLRPRCSAVDAGLEELGSSLLHPEEHGGVAGFQNIVPRREAPLDRGGRGRRGGRVVRRLAVAVDDRLVAGRAARQFPGQSVFRADPSLA